MRRLRCELRVDDDADAAVVVVVVVVAPAALVVVVGELGAESSMPSGTTGECGATLLLPLAAEEALLRFRLLRLRGLAICLDSSLSSSSSASSAPREGARLRDRFLAGDAADIAWALLLLRFLLLVLVLVLPRALALALAEEAMPGGLGASVLTTVAVLLLLLLLFFFFFLRAFFCFFPSLLPLPFELAGAAAAAAAAAVFVAGAALHAEVGD